MHKDDKLIKEIKTSVLPNSFLWKIVYNAEGVREEKNVEKKKVICSYLL